MAFRSNCVGGVQAAKAQGSCWIINIRERPVRVREEQDGKMVFSRLERD
jgi:hypothetical protein